MSQEEINEQTSEEVEGQTPETPDEASLAETGPSEEEQALLGEPEDTQIPKKFVGKSFDEILSSYQELEQYKGKLSSELGAERKRAEELEERLKALENASSQPSPEFQTYAQPTAPQPQQQPVDPFSNWDEQFESDPAMATKAAIQQSQDALRESQRMQQIQQQVTQAQNYFHQQKEKNPDYARREPLQRQLAEQFLHIIHPDFQYSVAALKLLDLASKGADVGYYEKTAADKALAEKVSVKEEKRQAYAESSYSEGEDSVNFEELSMEEMRKLLPKHER
jgi:hypothetical protein